MKNYFPAQRFKTRTKVRINKGNRRLCEEKSRLRRKMGLERDECHQGKMERKEKLLIKEKIICK